MTTVKCWASILGDCEGGQSKEHYVTKALYDDFVKVSGLRWIAPGETVELPITALSANILCASHNSALSPVDEEAVRFRNAVAKAVDCACDPTKWVGHPRYTSVDGLKLIRWFCKTICNLEMLCGRSPCPGLVKCAFGIGGRGTVGVYMHKHYGPPMNADCSHLQHCSWNHHLRGEEGLFSVLRFGIYEWLVSPFHLTQDELDAFGKATGLRHWFRAKPLVETLNLPIWSGRHTNLRDAHWIVLRFPHRRRTRR